MQKKATDNIHREIFDLAHHQHHSAHAAITRNSTRVLDPDKPFLSVALL
jgi:hypothetical protein